ncbi:MAG: LrgB family protein [Clostridia bacterium]|nr:LrgB family protein [Clostridia bacterium]
MLDNSMFFYTFLTLLFYMFGVFLQKKFNKAWLNPLLISILLMIIVVLCFDIKYEHYKNSTSIISFFLTPATVCLAVPLYEKLEELKKNALAILVGIFGGVITSGVCILAVAIIFGFDNELVASFLPKSVTTAIGVGMAEELGGISALTAISIVVTGVFGNIIAEPICKIFKITNPVAIGTAIGTSSHAGGTAKALEMGRTEGAISGLSIAVAGLMTVVVAPLFMKIFELI